MQLHEESIEIPGEVFHEREIPSSLALVSPLVVRLVEKLLAEGLLPEDRVNKVKLCLDEAITNAVKHGNRESFEKVVRVRMFRDDTSWGVLIEDEGEGFEIEETNFGKAGAGEFDEEILWAENGRGLPLMSMYMDECTYYDRGSTLLMRVGRERRSDA